MSWMDSWSRPPKSAQFPPPLYLTSGDEVPYCHTCGRVMSTRRKQTPATKVSPAKYCSERCRRTKPGAVDRQIEDAFVALLHGDVQSYQTKYDTSKALEQVSGKAKRSKGDSRITVWCSDVETLVFGSKSDPLKTAGRRKNRLPRGKVETGEWRSVDMESSSDGEKDFNSEDSDDQIVGGVSLTGNDEVEKDYINLSAEKGRPSQSKSDVHGSSIREKEEMKKIEETDEMQRKRREGQERANERELVRRAARRGVVFGFEVEESQEIEPDRGKGRKGGRGKRVSDRAVTETEIHSQPRRKCEAVVTKAAVVVEPSFAKGDWGIRWRKE